MEDDQTIDKATVVNMSLITRLGVPGNYSVDGETDLGGTVDVVWPLAVAQCFSLHDWNFCRRTTKLTRHATAPDNGWQYGFDLPGNKVGDPLKVLRQAGNNEDPLRDFTIEGFSLFANEPEVWARCKVNVDPQYWDDGFMVGFVIVLGAYLAVPVLQNEKMRDDSLAEAFGTPSQGGGGGYFGRLLAQN
ncbi:MAG: hypothetical protein AAAC47_04780, partial [Pararhizobium sp.]